MISIMENKKNKVKINGIFVDLILKYKISILIIFSVCILASFFYNNYYKIVSVNYSINVEIASLNGRDDVNSEANVPINLEELELKSLLYKKIISQYLNRLPKNVKDKEIIFNKETYSFYISFISIGEKVINVSDFLRSSNSNIRREQLKDIDRMYKDALWNSQQEEYFEFYNILEILNTNYPNIDFELPVDRFIEINKNEINQKSSASVNLKKLKYLIDNSNELFVEDDLYSINDWKIKDNKFNNLDNIFAGILFGSLISCFFLFFNSKYFRKKLSN